MTTVPTMNADHDLMLRIYTTMIRINEADKAIQRGLSAGELQFQYYLAGGQEAIPAGIAPHLRREDYAVITYRCIHDIVAKGTPLKEIMAEMYGRAAGTSKGKEGRCTSRIRTRGSWSRPALSAPDCRSQTALRLPPRCRAAAG